MFVIVNGTPIAGEELPAWTDDDPNHRPGERRSRGNGRDKQPARAAMGSEVTSSQPCRRRRGTRLRPSFSQAALHRDIVSLGRHIGNSCHRPGRTSDHRSEGQLVAGTDRRHMTEGRPRILVVDDEENIRFLVTTALSLAGMETVTAASWIRSARSDLPRAARSHRAGHDAP